MQKFRDILETHQITIYIGTIVIAITTSMFFPGTSILENTVNPALALMLFVTFLQVPLADIRKSLVQVRFLTVLFLVNFMIIPLLVAALIQFIPIDPIIRLGVLLVLLTPCIDYVVTFAHLGRADARLLLAATPALLIAQILLLPIYLSLFLGDNVSRLIRVGPFVQAFIWLIFIPFILATFAQIWAGRHLLGRQFITGLGLLPVPATALVLFVVIASVTSELKAAFNIVIKVIPIYIAFAIFAPLIGGYVARLFQLNPSASRSVAFSASTRNSLVVLPLAFSIPGATPMLPAIIVTQTLIELMSELIYVRLIPRLIKA